MWRRTGFGRTVWFSLAMRGTCHAYLTAYPAARHSGLSSSHAAPTLSPVRTISRMGLHQANRRPDLLRPNCRFLSDGQVSTTISDMRGWPVSLSTFCWLPVTIEAR